MKVNVEVSMEDIARMLKEPEDKHTPLEVALMKKCARLYESLKKKTRRITSSSALCTATT